MSTNLLLKIRGKAMVMLGVILLAGITTSSCSEEKDFSREKNLLVFVDPNDPLAIDGFYCPIEGGTKTLYVRTNAECSITFRTSDKEKEWFTFEDIGYSDQYKAQMYRVVTTPMKKESFIKRTGTLSIVCPEEYLGTFIVCTQGFGMRLNEDFAWLNNGTDTPYDPTGEVIFGKWTQAQIDKGWTSPLIGENTAAYLYGKKGYIKMGDGTHAAELVTPDMSRMINDSVAMISFKAVGYTSQEGETDNNELTLAIENGGKFLDGTKTKTLAVNHYDLSASALGTTMWENSTYTAFVVTDKLEKFTQNTKFRFSIPDGANRIFIDDVRVYFLDKDSYYLVDPNPAPNHTKWGFIHQ